MTAINAIPVTHNLDGVANELHEGAYYSRVISLLDASGTAINCSVASGNKFATNVPKVKFVDDAGSLLTTPGVVDMAWRSNGTAGQIDFVITNLKMRLFTAKSGRYDMMIMDDLDNVERVLIGTWKFSASGEVTTTSDPV